MTLWMMPFVVTLDPALRSAPSIAVLSVRVLAAVATAACGRAALWMWRARDAKWPNGRFLYAWGYAEIEHDTLRAVPIGDLSIELTGSWRGVGPIRLRLSDEAWSTVMHVAAAELDGVARVLETKADDFSRAGYRDGVAKIEGAPARRRLSRARRELAWVCLIALIATGAPLALRFETRRALEPMHPVELTSNQRRSLVERTGLSETYIAAIAAPSVVAGEPRLATEIDGCSPRGIVVDTVASYLTLALTRPRLGPARPGALPVFPDRSSPTRVWARCAWQVDTRSGMFSHAEARWGLDVRGQRTVERRAIVDVGDVLDTIARCGGVDARLEVSPQGLAFASLHLLRATIARDLFAEPDAVLGATPLAACIAPRLGGITVARVRDR